MAIVKVKLSRQEYPVVLGKDAMASLADKLVPLVRGGRLFVFYDAQVFALHGKRIRRALHPFRKKLIEFVVPSGEKIKSLTTVNRLYSFLLSEKISRSDFILACGGGVTSDLIGYAAATVLRGVRWGIVSTTLIGMIDASIGGKTGVNHRLGKNLVGAFWQPSLVVSDLLFLNTLPSRHFNAALGEILKYGGLIGGKLPAKIDAYFEKGARFDNPRLESIMIDCVRYKAAIVAQDEREKGKRMLLNLGHTFGHAIERTVGYGKLFHGEAVTIGLFAAVELSCLLKPGRAKYLSAYRRRIQQALRTIPRRRIDVATVLSALGYDKKRRGSVMRFVLLRKPGSPFITEEVEPTMVAVALESALDQYTLGGR